MAQTNYVWNGPAGGDWATTTNWTPNGIPGGNSGDTVTISNGGTPSIASPNSYTILNLTINNLTGGDAGSILTINSGATLTVNNTAVNAITLNGGSIVNNGTLNANTTDITAAFGILCGAPTTLPTVASQYGYSGTGKLSINTSSGTASSGAINFTGNTANTTYKFSFDNTSIITPSTFTLASGAYVIRVPGGNTIPVTIGGAGFSTAGSWGLIAMGGGGINLTVDTGTTLSSNLTGTAPRGIDIQNTSTTQPATLTNKGTINITGTTAQSGILLSTGTNAGAKIVLANEGTIDVDITCSTATQAPIRIQGTTGSNSASNITITNSAGAIMKLKNNRAFGTNFGNPMYISNVSTTPTISFTNNGSLSFTGNNVVFGGSNIRATLTNNGTITSNQQFSTIKLLNNSGKTIAFVKDAGTIDSPNALTTSLAFATNNGIIQTATGSDKLYNLAGVTAYGANSSIEPGGSTGIGIADFSKAAVTLSGKYILQVAGNSAAGTDYDQIQNTLATGSFTLSGATLDVTGIYTPAGPVTIDVITASTVLVSEGTITNQFSSVIGLTSGWSVNYISGTAGSVTGKVQLVYSAISPTATTWTGGTDTDWTIAGNWSAGVPDQNSDVTIVPAPNSPVIDSNVNIKSLSITSTNLTVNSEFNLTVKEAIVNNGTLTINNNANLIQVDNVSNTGSGTTTVNRNGNALYRNDYTIWSSPVTNATSYLKAFSPITLDTRFLNYTESTNLYSAVASPSTTPFDTAAGYLIRMPNNGSPAYEAGGTLIFQGVFTGVPNNGDIPKTIAYSGATKGYNMIGNPYPSTIDAASFIAVNTANIESSLYFWRKTNAAAGSAYAVYNPMGSTSATPTSALPNGTIQVGQGFFVKAKSASSVIFTNAMRVANNANQFFKTKAVQKDRLWLSLNNAAGAYSQTLVGYTADATLGVDMYDAKYINDSPVALTTDIASEEYSIQGRPTFDPTDIVALNFKTNVAGDYTIALDQFDGAFASGQDVYLLDNNTGAETNLKLGSYTFNAPAGTDNSRFTVKYQKTLKVGENDFNENSVSVYKNNGTIYVNSGEVAISNIKVFDIQGRLVAEQKNVKSTVASINNLKSTNQVLIVKVSGENNKVVTKKVLN